jgi:hypothetical protein
MKTWSPVSPIKASEKMPCYSELNGSSAQIMHQTVAELQATTAARELCSRTVTYKQALRLLAAMSCLVLLCSALIGCAMDGFKLSADHIRIKNADPIVTPVSN